MQTKQQIQQLLAQAGVMPNKRRGQNFLIDLNLMRLLIQTAGITENDIVLEIGCGTGSLTEGLAGVAGRVIAVEIDTVLAQIASSQLEKFQNVDIVVTDILASKTAIDSAVLDAVRSARRGLTGRFLLVANLPYSIACPAMLDLLTTDPRIDEMYVTVQKEVADRMTAGPSSDDYGSISIFLALTGQTNIFRILRPSVFWPQPQVDSAMVSFIADPEKIKNIHDMNLLSQVVSLFMQHRRKMVKAAVKFAQDELAAIHNWPSIFSDCAVDPHARPEQLPPESFLAIANLCREYLR